MWSRRVRATEDTANAMGLHYESYSVNNSPWNCEFSGPGKETALRASHGGVALRLLFPIPVFDFQLTLYSRLLLVLFLNLFSVLLI